MAVLMIAVLLAAVGLFLLLVIAIAPPRGERLSSGMAGGDAVRQVYSPEVAKDPYVRKQWERSVEALDQACRERGEFCDEAAKARASLGR